VSYLLDTNHWSHIQRNHPVVAARLKSLPANTKIYIPVVAQGELLAGIGLLSDGARRQRLEKWYQQSFADDSAVLPITADVAYHYAQIFVHLRQAGTPIETNDIWIAAIARANNLTVVSADQHFRSPRPYCGGLDSAGVASKGYGAVVLL
jgi:tRNA(fMet)-specific endonuclease VapC